MSPGLSWSGVTSEAEVPPPSSWPPAWLEWSGAFSPLLRGEEGAGFK